MSMVIGAGLYFIPTKAKSYAAEAIVNKTDDFSQVDANGNVFSVEKIYVASGDNKNAEPYENNSIIQSFLEAPSDLTGWTSMPTAQNKSGGTEKENYYFKHIPSATNPNKTVVTNNTYVMLNNNVSVDGSFSAIDEHNTDKQEAILISFGQYDLITKKPADDDEGKEITQMNITAKLNGNDFVDANKKSRLPAVRQFGGEGNNNYQDFAFIIPQLPEYEGHWYLDVEYYYAESLYTQHFEFYLLFNSSYTQKDVIGVDFYTAAPHLSMDNLNLGESSQYPTLTYDYTKYNLVYTHNANGIETKYTYKFNSATKKLDYTINSIEKNISDSRAMEYYSKNSSGANYVVFAFTEGGNYSFEFEYVYGGYVRNEQSRPSMNLSKIKLDLKINGFEVKYSKYGYEEAQMRYITFVKSAYDSSAKADLIVPNGHNVNLVADTNKMSAVYSTVESTLKKVGSVEASKDANVNIEDFITSGNSVANIIESINGTADIVEEFLTDYVDSKYVKTNQGSIWLSSTNDYVDDRSFYYFSKTGRITIDDIKDSTNKRDLTNTTEFNKTGYYLVFVGVDTDDNEATVEFYQVFAFQYTTDTININVVDAEDETKIIGAGKYTNKAVEVWWEEPDVFDRKIEANYYFAKSHNKDTILKSTKKSLANHQKIGYEVINSGKNWATYVVELKSEGDAATYRTFTIDTQDITGVAVYAVKPNIVNGETFYEFEIDDATNNLVKINAISNYYSTLFWDNKASGAEITTKYNFTPFVKDGSLAISEVKNNNEGVWYSTNYKLGTTASGLEISKVPALYDSGVQISSSQVFSQQGIYEFTITDEAGNSCRYMFVVDKTESYFYVDSTPNDGNNRNGVFTVSSNEIYSDDVKYSVGTHKVMQLDDSKLSSDVKAAINGTLNSVGGYFAEDGNNIASIQNVFKKYENENYLIVKNMFVESKTSEDILDNETSINSTSGIINGNNSRIISRNSTDLGSSVIRKLYLIGENQYKTEKLKNTSFITIEVNTDNSRGMVYTRNDRKFTTSPTTAGDGVSRLTTGTDLYKDEYGDQIYGIEGAHATSDKYVVFTWLVGADETKVKSVEYTFYEFDSNLNYTNDEFYFYKENGTTTTVFDSDVYSEGAKVDDDGKRAFAVINESNGITREGLYVVTRTYAQSVVSGSKDFTTFTYYFIVDRSGVIDGAAGREIKIYLLEKETPFDDFNQHNAMPGDFTYINENNEKIDVDYNIYLTTNKVPATAYIPVGKYFNGTNGSNYYAGRLTFSIYFKDTEGCIGERDKPYLLFEINETESAKPKNWVNNTFKINFEESVTLNNILKEKFTAWADGANWMYMPGDYAIVINDMVEGANGHNQKVVAFRVEQEKPKADIYVSTEEDSTVRYDQISGNQTTLTTNQEYVRLEIPTYNKDLTDAQLDEHYLVITQQIGGTTREYINNPYVRTGNPIHEIDERSDVVKNENDKLTIFLKTTNDSGELIVDKLITYTITVRYRLWVGTTNADRKATYLNCYVVGNNKYYEQTYTVVIDRIAPTININNFTEQTGANYDNLIVEYNKRDNVSNMFESAMYDNSGILYFTNRYTAFYNDTQKTSELYALKVNKETKFNTTDIEKVYARPHADASLQSLKLNLPITSMVSDSYLTTVQYNRNYTYEDIIGMGKDYGVYEIVEFDKAGNMTQYLVEYGPVSKIKISAHVQKINLKTEEEFYDGLSFFDLTSVKVESEENFYQIVVKDRNLNTISTVYSDFTTNVEKIASKIRYAIITNGVENDDAQRYYGQYFVYVNSRAGQVKYTINYNNRDNIRDLSLEKLVNKSTSPWTLMLAEANELVGNELYYLKTIYVSYLNEEGEMVKRTYTSTDGDRYVNELSDEFDIYDGNGKLVGFRTTEGTIYIVQAKDSADREVSTLKFKSGDDDYVYYGIWFGENKENPANAIQEGTRFYSFQKATIQYDKTAFSSVEVEYSINGRSQLPTTQNQSFNSKSIIEFKENFVILYPYFSDTGSGALLEFKVNLYARTVMGAESIEHSYTVIMDTRTNSVQLKDNKTGDYESLQFDANIGVMDTSTPKMSSGSKMLIWTESSHEKFNYSYVLYETLKEADAFGNNLRIKNLDNEPGFYYISTGIDSLGEYRFVVEVSDKYGNSLGRKIYTFSVKAELNKVYYVQNSEGVNVEANSTFTKADLINKDLSEMSFNFSLPNILGDIPLYITNEDLSVGFINNSDVVEKIYTAIDASLTSADRSKYFEIHEIDAKTFKLYFGILKITNNEGDLINRIAITDQDNQTTSIWSKQQIPTTIEGISVVGTEFNLEVDSIAQSHPFLNKNMIIVDVKYGDEIVDSFKLKLTNDKFELKGNGTYTFEVRDLAGNVQVFQTQYGAEFDYVQATVLREVEVNINGTAPLNKAYYNGIVNFSIVNRSNYEQGTISWYATRNGVEYMNSSNVFSYEFEEYGSYRIVVTAKPKNSNEALSKVITFAIINPKEAKKSFDLTNLAGYNITQVLDNDGEDITEEFLVMLESNKSGKIVSYEMILNNPELNIGSGKQTFTLTYEVADGLYPVRTTTFQFTLNNETPYIECSLAPGEDTTKEFSITFNPGIIFKQIGESVICVNGQEVVRINENSSLELVQKSFSEKVNGSGDYYITIQSLSGDIISAFKVTIKEPLNAGAIIIIIVVSVVVIGLVVTFILLRTKMRIR